MDEKQINDTLVAAFETPKSTWRTIDTVAKDTGVDQEIVTRFVERNRGRIVRSAAPSPDGQDLFTTRSHFRQRAGVVDRILGAFKNRID